MAVAAGDVARERTDRLRTPDPHVIVLFGATGDLARRKLIPGLFHLGQAGLLPEEYRIVGTSLDDLSEDDVPPAASRARRCGEFCRLEFGDDQWRAFSERLTYVPVAGRRAGRRRREGRAGHRARRRAGSTTSPCRPRRPAPIVRTLGEAGLAERARVIMEKPFGTDLESARELNEAVHEVFREDQVFRIDHFLGKEAALNMLALRFANGFLEPLWNREHIDHVQVDVPEKLSIGTRGAFYEQTGAFRDMIVTHLLQIVGVVAMEPPPSLEPRALVEEKTKVFRSLLPLDPDEVVRGQYEGYREEPGVDPDSQVETFVAARVQRRQLALGGRAVLPAHRQVHGRGRARGEHRLPRPAQVHVPGGRGRRPRGPGPPDLRPRRHAAALALLLRQAPGARHPPREGEHAVLAGRDPRRQERDVLEAYERLIHDAMTGDRTLFTTAEGARAAVGGLRPAAPGPVAAAALRQGLVGPDRDRRADRAAPLAAAVRAPVARRSLSARPRRGDGAASVIPSTAVTGVTEVHASLGEPLRRGYHGCVFAPPEP